MRKIIVLLLVLLAMAASAAFAEGEKAPGLFELYSADGNETVLLGAAVSPYEGILITAASVLPEHPEQLVISDGVNFWKAQAAAPDSAGICAMILYDVSEQKPSAGCCELYSGAVQPEGCVVFTGDENHSRVYRKVYDGAAIAWRSSSCMLLSLSGSVMPGSPLVTEDGRVAGIAAGEWAEGSDRVIFLSAEGMYQSMAESLDAFTGRTAPTPPEGLELTAEANTVTVDWSRMALPEQTEGEELYLIIADTMNRYLTYFRIGEGDTKLSVTLTPGRTYYCSIDACANPPALVPDSYAVIALPEAEKLTDFGFASRVCAIAEAPQEGLPANGLPAPVTEVTEELLRSGRAYFYSSTTYEVAESIQGISLLITLTDPAGNNYRYESEWMYDYRLTKDDTWAVALNETGLLDLLNGSGYPAGIYEVAMYIGGALADSFTFELKSEP